MGKPRKYTSDHRTNLPQLIDGKIAPSSHLALKHLSLADRYWQFRLRAYRHAFMTLSLPQVRSEHSASLMKQIMVDIHPIFGAYILYLHALESRAGHEFQAALDHLHFAMEWLEPWRVKGNTLDLAQKVRDFNAWLNEDASFTPRDQTEAP